MADYRKGYPYNSAPPGPAANEAAQTAGLSPVTSTRTKKSGSSIPIDLTGSARSVRRGRFVEARREPLRNGGAYDPEVNLTYWGTGNPNPGWSGDVRSPGTDRRNSPCSKTRVTHVFERKSLWPPAPDAPQCRPPEARTERLARPLDGREQDQSRSETCQDATFRTQEPGELMHHAISKRQCPAPQAWPPEGLGGVMVEQRKHTIEGAGALLGNPEKRGRSNNGPAALFIPACKASPDKRVMSKEEVRTALSVLDVRERLVSEWRFSTACGRAKSCDPDGEARRELRSNDQRLYGSRNIDTPKGRKGKTLR